MSASGAFRAVAARPRGPLIPPDDGLVRLVLVRHGRTEANLLHVLDTRVPGPPLDDVGLAQADEVAELLAGWPVRAVHASVMQRARQTAEPIARTHGLTVEPLSGVHEISVGDLNGRSDDAARSTFDDVFASWWAGDLDRPQPGGESATDLRARFLPAVDRALEPVGSGAVVVVSHGATIRLGVSALLRGRPGEQHSRETLVPNTGRVVLRRDPDGWSLETWDPMPEPSSAPTGPE